MSVTPIRTRRREDTQHGTGDRNSVRERCFAGCAACCVRLHVRNPGKWTLNALARLSFFESLDRGHWRYEINRFSKTAPAASVTCIFFWNLRILIKSEADELWALIVGTFFRRSKNVALRNKLILKSSLSSTQPATPSTDGGHVAQYEARLTSLRMVASCKGPCDSQVSCSTAL